MRMSAGALGAIGSTYLKMIDTRAAEVSLNSTHSLNVWYPVIDIDGPCVISHLMAHVGMGGSMQIRVTFDDVEKTYSASNGGSNSRSSILVIDNGRLNTSYSTTDSPILNQWFAKKKFKLEIKQTSIFGGTTYPNSSAYAKCALVELEGLE
ncbi:hypothetical protein MW329_000509 [Vibrio vulnificus]|nr:hypothetical protein [Vibrio vulnificus]